MKPTQALHEAGQSLWFDDITREILDDGTLARAVDQLSVTGLTSNPSIFDHAISKSGRYDAEIRGLRKLGYSGEALFVELALADLGRAADLFLPAHRATAGADGWVSLEVSPLLANETEETIAEAIRLSRRAHRENLFVKIPGTEKGVPAIEEAIFAGVPINVTLLFSPEQYRASANAYMKGLERRIAAGLAPDVRSVASVFISRWDRAIAGKVPENLRNSLGIAIGRLCYKMYRDILESDRWQRLASHGAPAQRLLFASTSTKDPKAPDTLYVAALAAPNTINTMPRATLEAFADHGKLGAMLPRDGGDAAAVIEAHRGVGIDVDGLAAQLQRDGAAAFSASWKDLLAAIEAKGRALTQ